MKTASVRTANAGRVGEEGGAARDRHSAAQPKSPFHLCLGYSCASYIHLETHPLPYHMHLPLTLILFFEGWGAETTISDSAPNL